MQPLLQRAERCQSNGRCTTRSNRIRVSGDPATRRRYKEFGAEVFTPGQRADLNGINRENGRAYVTSAWETAEPRQPSHAPVRDQRRQAGELMGGIQIRVDEFEVVFIEVAETVGATRI
jgi:hypothetical protein